MADTANGNGARPAPGPTAGRDEIQADIDRTRVALGDTAEALAGKLDVSAALHRKVDDAKQAARQRALPVAAVAVTVLVIGLLVRRRRRRR